MISKDCQLSGYVCAFVRVPVCFSCTTLGVFTTANRFSRLIESWKWYKKLYKVVVYDYLGHERGKVVSWEELH